MELLRLINSRVGVTHIVDRKFRLLAVAFTRRVLHLVRDQSKQVVLDIAEQCADGLLPYGLLREYYEKADLNWHTIGGIPSAWTAEDYALGAIGDVVHPSPYKAADHTQLLAQLALFPTADRSPFGELLADNPESSFQLRLIHDVADDLFLTHHIDSNLLSEAVVSLARMIYTIHGFDKLPILADALEDAGCDDSVILNHCRGPDPHVRGCWVVDLILGKK